MQINYIKRGYYPLLFLLKFIIDLDYIYIYNSDIIVCIIVSFNLFMESCIMLLTDVYLIIGWLVVMVILSLWMSYTTSKNTKQLEELRKAYLYPPEYNE